MASSDGAITRLISAWRNGEPAASDGLLSATYGELRILAAAAMRRERRHHTLGPTALCHEVYLRLERQREKNWTNRAHFFASASVIMRRVLVDHARKRNRAGDAKGLSEGAEIAEGLWPGAKASLREKDLIAVESALCDLRRNDPFLGRLIELRYFAGFTIQETADLVDLSPATVKRQLAFAKAFLKDGVDRVRATEI